MTIKVNTALPEHVYFGRNLTVKNSELFWFDFNLGFAKPISIFWRVLLTLRKNPVASIYWGKKNQNLTLRTLRLKYLWRHCRAYSEEKPHDCLWPADLICIVSKHIRDCILGRARLRRSTGHQYKIILQRSCKDVCMGAINIKDIIFSRVARINGTMWFRIHPRVFIFQGDAI